jgi:hypothetical protein
MGKLRFFTMRIHTQTNPSQHAFISKLCTHLFTHARLLCAMLWSYKRVALLQKTRAHGDVRVDSCTVVGLAVEQALRLAFSAAHGALPKELEAQTAADHLSVKIARVMAPGAQRPATLEVAVSPADAALALDIARRCVAALDGESLRMRILAVDYPHAGGRHDILATPVVPTRRGHGLVSVEIKCREVVKRRPTGFNWQATLEEEATVLWEAVKVADPSRWVGRMLLFVELRRPCHSGSIAGLHASVIWRNATAWATLFGWRGFWPRGHDLDVAPSAPTARTAPPIDAEGRLRTILGRHGIQCGSDSWVLLTAFLRAVNAPAKQTKRYVDGATKMTWTSITGRKPRENTDWAYMSANRGGGQGAGVLHCKFSFLVHVYTHHYMSR